MIRILQIGMTDNLGGIENYLINYYRHINKDKIQFDFINIYKKDLCFTPEILSYGGKIFNVPNYYKHPFKYIFKVIEIIKENNYSIVHCNMNSAVMLYPLIAAKLAKTKVIIAHAHNSSSDKGLLKSVLHNINKHLIGKFANSYFACSKTASNWFFDKKTNVKKSIHIINNGIDTKKFIYNKNIRERKREELAIQENSLVIGHVGRFNKQKNHAFLIDIFSEYHKYNSNSQLLLIGQGPLKDTIVEKVSCLGLTESVKFLGIRSDTNELYQAMDVFVLPSLYEGLPLVGVEAQYSGLLCLFSKNITRELEISLGAKYIDLLDIQKFKDEIIKYNNERYEVENSNFDIKQCCIMLEDTYTSLVK